MQMRSCRSAAHFKGFRYNIMTSGAQIPHCPYAKSRLHLGKQHVTEPSNDGVKYSAGFSCSRNHILIKAFTPRGWMEAMRWGREGTMGWPSFDALLNALGIFFACHWLWITASPFNLLSADLFFIVSVAARRMAFYEFASLAPF